MKHYGDITKIDGSKIEKVECIVGGSPCQDLSCAGKRAGLSGARSGLFMEQIRIIKEMRADDEANGRSAFDIRPYYMVWENVPGALSSKGGEDFRAVLEETAHIKDPDAAIPRPPKGKWSNSGCILGDGWSIAWVIRNARFFGTPQRRRRIALVASFRDTSAPEILFKSQGVQRHNKPCAQAREEHTRYTELGTGVSAGREEFPADSKGDGRGLQGTPYGLAIQDSRGIGCAMEDEITSLTNGTNPGWQEDVSHPIGVDLYNQSVTGDSSKPLTNKATDSDHIPVVITEGKPSAFRKQGHPQHSGQVQKWEQTDEADTLNVFDNSEMRTPTVVVYDNHPQDSRVVDVGDTANSVCSKYGTGGNNVPLVCEPMNWDGSDTAPTLTSRNAGGAQRMPDKDNFNAVC